ncbi:MAG TPA: Nudix family hydrolase [Gammaproteobacteria bacterium]|jgi:8-oxo-dGTP diphosphatase|nr:Nudix family hydrolase [Gammaproteobacteria bacterium]
MHTGASLHRIQVVAAVLRDRQGRVLIAERPAGKPLAGFWEFPGGKLEPAEPAFDALKRELHEELGIRVRHAYRMLRFSHHYPEREVELDVWRVTAWEGEPASQEGQRLEWVLPEELRDWQLLPADEPIVAALKLPPLMLVTPDPDRESAFLEKLQRSLKAGVDLVQLRAPGMETERFDNLALAVFELCREHGACLILNASPEQARMLHADGLHLSQQRSRKLDPSIWDGSLRLGISCHSATEVHSALEYAPDYLCLGPVQESATHPGVTPLGWQAFAALAAMSPVPVYAIGGLKPADLEVARRHGAHGIAASRSLWDIEKLG